jgi:hypothetical protein
VKPGFLLDANVLIAMTWPPTALMTESGNGWRSTRTMGGQHAD